MHRLAPSTFIFVAGLVALLAWDASGLDLVLADWAGGAEGFPLRHDWLLTSVLHDGARWLSWAFATALCVGVWHPFGPLARLPSSRRMQLAASTLAAAAAVSLAKGFSTTSCPWDLQHFGGVASYVPHWVRGADGGAGHCFPAGHAASGFAFVSGGFAFREHDLRIARLWVAGAVTAGLVLGIAQQLRGAHFMSHTLWTAWACFAIAWAIDRHCGSRRVVGA